jgi:NADPH:quinone reductase-like Zn-dependent oxidoreductase
MNYSLYSVPEAIRGKVVMDIGANASEQETRKVLVTGAGGFVGGRVVEMAYLSGFAKVIAGLRSSIKRNIVKL